MLNRAKNIVTLAKSNVNKIIGNNVHKTNFIVEAVSVDLQGEYLHNTNTIIISFSRGDKISSTNELSLSLKNDDHFAINERAVLTISTSMSLNSSGSYQDKEAELSVELCHSYVDGGNNKFEKFGVATLQLHKLMKESAGESDERLHEFPLMLRHERRGAIYAFVSCGEISLVSKYDKAKGSLHNGANITGRTITNKIDGSGSFLAGDSKRGTSSSIALASNDSTLEPYSTGDNLLLRSYHTTKEEVKNDDYKDLPQAGSDSLELVTKLRKSEDRSNELLKINKSLGDTVAQLEDSLRKQTALLVKKEDIIRQQKLETGDLEAHSIGVRGSGLNDDLLLDPLDTPPTALPTSFEPLVDDFSSLSPMRPPLPSPTRHAGKRMGPFAEDFQAELAAAPSTLGYQTDSYLFQRSESELEQERIAHRQAVLENDALKLELKALQEQANQVVTVKNELSECRKLNSELKSALEASKAQLVHGDKTCHDQEAALAMLQQSHNDVTASLLDRDHQLTVLRRELSSAQSLIAKRGQQEAVVEALQASHDDLTKALTERERELLESRAECRTVTTQLNDNKQEIHKQTLLLQQDLTALKVELDTVYAQRDDANMKIKDVLERLHSAEQLRSDLEKQIAYLRRQLADSLETLSNVEQENIELVAAARSIESLQATVSSIRKEQETQEADHCRVVEDYQRQISSLRTEIIDAKAALSNTQDEQVELSLELESVRAMYALASKGLEDREREIGSLRAGAAVATGAWVVSIESEAPDTNVLKTDSSSQTLLAGQPYTQMAESDFISAEELDRIGRLTPVRSLSPTTNLLDLDLGPAPPASVWSSSSFDILLGPIEMSQTSPVVDRAPAGINSSEAAVQETIFSHVSIEGKDSEVARLQTELRSMVEKLDDCMAEWAKLVEFEGYLVVQRDAALEQLEFQSQEIRTLEGRVESCEYSKAMLASELNEERDRLKRSLEALDHNNALIIDRERELINSLESREKELIGSLAEMEEQLADLNSLVEQQAGALEHKDMLIKKQEEELSELKVKLEYLQQVKSRLASSLSEESAKCERLHTQIIDLQSCKGVVHPARGLLDSSTGLEFVSDGDEALAVTMKSELDRLISEELRDISTEPENNFPKRVSVQKSITRPIYEIGCEEGDAIELADRTSVLTDEISSLQSDYRNLQQQLQDKQLEYRRAIQMSKRREESLAQENESLLHELIAAKVTLASLNADTDAQQKQIRTLQKELTPIKSAPQPQPSKIPRVRLPYKDFHSLFG